MTSPSSVQPGVPTPYERLDAIVHEYAYTFDLDEYIPSDQERDVVKQAINGLICREDFMETILAARQLTHDGRRACEQHPCCGAGLGHPHYPQCVNARAAIARAGGAL